MKVGGRRGIKLTPPQEKLPSRSAALLGSKVQVYAKRKQISFDIFCFDELKTVFSSILNVSILTLFKSR